MKTNGHPPPAPAPPPIDPRVQELVDQGTKLLRDGFLRHGLAPRALFVVVEFMDPAAPNEAQPVHASATFAIAPPQAQMNAIDRVVEKLRTVAERYKVAINSHRHAPKPQSDA